MATAVVTNTDPRLGDNEYKHGVIILTGQDLSGGSVLGEISIGAISGVVTGTGNPTISAIVAGSATLVGDYVVDFSGATAFDVIDPNGVLLGSGATGVEFSNEHLTFTITVGGTPADATTVFTLTVAEGSGKLKLADKSSVDGSQIGKYILVNALDTSATGTNADVTGYSVLAFGRVRGELLIFGGTDVIADQEANLRDVGIRIETALTSLD